jgi:hypothetical protein
MEGGRPNDLPLFLPARFTAEFAETAQRRTENRRRIAVFCPLSSVFTFYSAFSAFSVVNLLFMGCFFNSASVGKS